VVKQTDENTWIIGNRSIPDYLPHVQPYLLGLLTLRKKKKEKKKKKPYFFSSSYHFRFLDGCEEKSKNGDTGFKKLMKIEPKLF